MVKTNGCYGCHALGNKATRTIPAMFSDMKPEEAWARRLLSGQAMTSMATSMAASTRRARSSSSRIGPTASPPASCRPRRRGRRGASATSSSRSGTSPIRSTICTTLRYRQAQADGQRQRPDLRRAENSTDIMPVLDPVKHKASHSSCRCAIRRPDCPRTMRVAVSLLGRRDDLGQPDQHAQPDVRSAGPGLVTSRVGPPDNPDFCKKGSDHPSAKVFPLVRSTRHVSMLDPKTGKITLIRTCFRTHHLIFAEDANDTLWLARADRERRVGLARHQEIRRDRRRSEVSGLDADLIDTNGNGKRDGWVEPNQPVDPPKISGSRARLSHRRQPARRDDLGFDPTFPGYFVRVDPGANPSETALAEIYEPPAPGYGPRGLDVDRNGSPGVPLSSSHMGRFDRSKCKVLRRAGNRDRPALPGGLDALSVPRSQIQRRARHRQRGGELLHLGRPIRHFRLGRNVLGPPATPTIAPRVARTINGSPSRPVSAGLLPKWIDGRVDDPNAGWKGRASGRPTAPAHRSSGNRQGHAAEALEVPVSARPAGALTVCNLSVPLP